MGPLNIYLNWVLLAVAGRLAEADALMNLHGEAVRVVAGLLRHRFGLDLKPLHRGVVVEPDLIVDGGIQPDPARRFVSFTESPHVARWFANPASVVNGWFVITRPHAAGYLLAHTAEPTNVLFHWSWAVQLRLVEAGRMHPDIPVGQLAWNLMSQREVILASIGALPAVPYEHEEADVEIDEALSPPLEVLV